MPATTAANAIKQPLTISAPAIGRDELAALKFLNGLTISGRGEEERHHAFVALSSLYSVKTGDDKLAVLGSTETLVNMAVGALYNVLMDTRRPGTVSMLGRNVRSHAEMREKIEQAAYLLANALERDFRIEYSAAEQRISARRNAYIQEW